MPKKKNSSFESSIHVWRARKRMTQQELADKIGVARVTIVQLERNRYNPSLLLAHDIAEVFEVPIEQVFTFKKINEEEHESDH
ncbi:MULTISPECIES: helix-turn-helix transcriptional regulator [unclassified Enterococcus]|uniref:helix-turn-helix transcriptional regulator n=1 Tax=unclassified Enterococcus TaxID=2608891 RepID=UPI001CE07511|nr:MULTISPECIES: helix-turn-helix transcriptional regulator [unclassified Enterococcus]MCA5014546.1 helix-turn-helix transcriptional regulator [Enterococcus sp. S23]MCA5017799.1 helix-turn-helix transcriptional regulator [Enterococcus sp. S22(2020)]